MSDASRIAVLCGAAILSACSTSGPDRPAELQAAAAAAEGTVPDYCPQVTLREGTAVLREGEGENLAYVASVADTTRECRVRNGELFMEVGIAGRLVPGTAARPGSATLPIRVAIVRGSDVLYSTLGQQQVSTDPSGGPKDFVYVDRAIRIPEPTARDLVVYAGFDEGA